MRRVALGALLGTALWASPAAAGDYEALRAAVGVRSGFSGGSQSVGELAQAARARGLDALVLTDDYRASIEHGWPGLRRLTSRRTNAPSLPDGVAVQEYLEAVRRVQDSQPDLVLLEGVRATPFYRWEIDWKRARWTLRGARRKMLAVGLDGPAAYGALPVGGSRGVERWGWPSLLLVWPLAGLLYAWLAAGCRPRWARWTAGVAAALLLVNNAPFRLPRWSAYGGDPGAEPYQAFIDHVRGHGGAALWAPADSLPRPWPVKVLGGRVELPAGGPPAPDLAGTHGYVAFAALDPGAPAVAEPGEEWDRLLGEYLSGRRPAPVWATGQVGGGSRDERQQESWGGIETVFWARERSRQGLFEALLAGRMYAVRAAENRLVLQDFGVSRGEVEAVSGGTAVGTGWVRVRGAISLAGGARDTIHVRIVRAGTVVAAVQGTGPIEFGCMDSGPSPGERTYYRVLARAPGAELVSNPIFVESVGSAAAASGPAADSSRP